MTQSSLERQDPAERLRSLRVFYRDWRPTRLGRLVNRCWAWLSGRGLTPHILLTLQVKGRTTGRLHSTVLVPVTYKDQRYLVSMLGDSSEWVRNVRAAGGEAFVKRGQAHPVMLTEMPVEQRARILKAHVPRRLKRPPPLPGRVHRAGRRVRGYRRAAPRLFASTLTNERGWIHAAGQCGPGWLLWTPSSP